MPKKVFLSFLFIFILGFGIGHESSPKPIVETREVVKEVKMDDTNWRSLKTIDDEILLTAGAGFGACSDTLQAAGNFDVKGIEAGGEELRRLTSKITSLGNERASVLVKLGY